MLDTIPDDIQYDNTSLKIRWKDGKDCSYNLLQLRRKCPCAQCRGGHGPVANRQTDSIQQINLVSWKKVGRYALQLTLSDNHDLGIYTYDLLRKGCDEGTGYVPPDERSD